MGAGNEVCGAAVRLELQKQVLADGNRNKTKKGDLWCTWTHYKKDAWQQLLLLYDS